MQIIIATLFIIYYLYIKIVYGGLVFSEFFLMSGILLIIYHFIKTPLKHFTLVYLPLKTLAILLLIVFIILESIMIIYPKHDTKNEADYLIVLGAAVKQTTISLTLKARLDAALDYIERTNDDVFIVVSGGQGKGEAISEARAMHDYLVANGVEDSKIILEDQSKNTFENFEFSKQKIEEHSNTSIENLKIKVTTSDFHSFRSSILAKRTGYQHVTFYSSASRLQFAPTYYAREFFALIKALVLYK